MCPNALLCKGHHNWICLVMRAGELEEVLPHSHCTAVSSQHSTAQHCTAAHSTELHCTHLRGVLPPITLDQRGGGQALCAQPVGVDGSRALHRGGGSSSSSSGRAGKHTQQGCR
jgi:hypothetical protein